MKKDLAMIRAVEVVIALVIVLVLYFALSAGALTSIGKFATGWYSQKVDGLFTVSVVDTSIKLPQLDRASLPIGSEPGAPETTPVPETPGEAATLANT